jgi:hypothetical protein
MRAIVLGYILSISAAGALLAGCGGGLQSAIGVPDAAQQGRAAATHASRSGSWMLPEAKYDTLLYVSIQTECCTGSGNDLYAFAYPSGKLVGELDVTSDSMYGLCADTKGDVFVTAYSDYYFGSTIYEYAHGGTSPIATLSDPWNGDGCSVDPTTGNLAVANWFTGGSKQVGNVLVYTLPNGTYTEYYDPKMYYYKWCAYDPKGNLYVDDAGVSNRAKGTPPLAVLHKGQSTFTNIHLDKSVDFVTDSLQWYGSHLVIAGYERSIGPETLLRVRVKGAKGYVVGTTVLKDYGHGWGDDAQFAIRYGHVISGGYPGYNLQEWLFPGGGDPRRKIARSPTGWWYGIAFSE